MHLTKNELKSLIKKETQKVLNEISFADLADTTVADIRAEVEAEKKAVADFETRRDRFLRRHRRAQVAADKKAAAKKAPANKKAAAGDESANAIQNLFLTAFGLAPQKTTSTTPQKTTSTTPQQTASTTPQQTASTTPQQTASATSARCKPPKKLCCGKCLYPEECKEQCPDGKSAMEGQDDESWVGKSWRDVMGALKSEFNIRGSKGWYKKLPYNHKARVKYRKWYTTRGK